MIPIPARGSVGARVCSQEARSHTLASTRTVANLKRPLASTRPPALASTRPRTLPSTRPHALASTRPRALGSPPGLTLYMASGPARGFRPRSAVRAKQPGANIESATISSDRGDCRVENQHVQKEVVEKSVVL